MIAYLALAALGATIAPFDDDTPNEEVTTEARELCLTAMVTSRDLVDIGCAPVRVEPTDPRTGPIPWVTPGSVASQLPRSGRVGPDAALVLLKTSGSTSRPKRWWSSTPAPA
jgi:acyl-coenzyme A synthetase/AMP-(fatty) acid ligase